MFGIDDMSLCSMSGMLVVFSQVNAETNCSFRMFALAVLRHHLCSSKVQHKRPVP